MHKKIYSAEEIKDSLTTGIDKIANIVKSTLGPGGRVIMIERMGQALDGTQLSPKLTKDGVSVAMECGDEDDLINTVIQTVKNICKKTNVDAGDGTTTAIVLGQAIYREAMAFIKETGMNPQIVKEQLELLSETVKERLTEKAVPVKEFKNIKEVAVISANGDEEIGEVIAQAFSAVGAEGVVTVDEGSSNKVVLNVVDGYQFNRGAQLRDAFFNSKNKNNFEAESPNGVAVIIYDGRLQSHTQIIPILYKIAGIDPETGEASNQIPPILILANEFSSDVLQWLLISKQDRGLQICCVEGPHVTSVRTGYYDDIAYYTGGTRMGNGNRSLESMEMEDVGLVKKVVVDKYKTTMYDGFGDEEDVITRVDQLKVQKSEAESPYDAQVLADRIAVLTQGVAKIEVGGTTELEIKEKYDRIEDALNAARAAIQQGVVPGGGVALLQESFNFSEYSPLEVSSIMRKALRYPITQICANIGLSETEIADIIEHIRQKAESGTPDVVFDARRKQYAGSIEAGIIDPVKVTKTALQNAMSIAGLLITSGGAVIYSNKKIISSEEQ